MIDTTRFDAQMLEVFQSTFPEASTDSCPDSGIFWDSVSGNLTEQKLRELSEHCSRCASCAQSLAIARDAFRSSQNQDTTDWADESEPLSDSGKIVVPLQQKEHRPSALALLDRDRTEHSSQAVSTRSGPDYEKPSKAEATGSRMRWLTILLPVAAALAIVPRVWEKVLSPFESSSNPVEPEHVRWRSADSSDAWPTPVQHGARFCWRDLGSEFRYRAMLLDSMLDLVQEFSETNQNCVDVDPKNRFVPSPSSQIYFRVKAASVTGESMDSPLLKIDLHSLGLDPSRK